MFRLPEKGIALLILLLLFRPDLYGSCENSRAEIAFLTADVKVSASSGVKICEVQHGILSTFDGDLFCNGGRCTVAENFLKILGEKGFTCWAVAGDIAELKLLRLMEKSENVAVKRELKAIAKDPLFSELTREAPRDPSSLESYKALLFAKKLDAATEERLLKRHPGLLIFDRATHPYWCNKEKMSRLFSNNSELAPAKPRWNCYSKREGRSLSDRIIRELKSHYFVIKPLAEFLGRGVIIAGKEELGSTIKMIAKKGKKCRKHPLPEYRYWADNGDKSFIVEEFIPSDPLAVEELGGRLFDPTLRAAYLLFYDRGEIALHLLGANWFLPGLSLDEPGSFSEKHKGCNRAPYYTPVDEKELSLIREKLDPVMQSLYRGMISLSRNFPKASKPQEGSFRSP